MRQFVIFSKKEMEKLCRDEEVKDNVNRVTYMSEAAYERYLENKERLKEGKENGDSMP